MLLWCVEQTNYVYSYDVQGSVYQNLSLITPGAGVLVLGRGHIVSIHNSSPLLVYTLLHGSDKWSIKQIWREESVKIVNFIFIWAEGLMLGHGYIGHYSEYILASTLSIYITLNAIVLSEYNAAFLIPLLIFIFIL